MKSFDDSLIPLMQEENALASRYSKLMSTAAKIMWEGRRTEPFLCIKAYALPDQNTRRKHGCTELFRKETG